MKIIFFLRLILDIDAKLKQILGDGKCLLLFILIGPWLLE